MKASRVRAKFKNLPTEGASECLQIGLDRRQIVDHNILAILSYK